MSVMSDYENEFAQFCKVCSECDDISQVAPILNDDLVFVYGFDMLSRAVKYERVSTLAFLLERYPNLISREDENGNTILFFALMGGCYTSIYHMLQYAPQLIRMLANDGSTIFHQVAMLSDVPFELLDAFIECDLKTNGPLYVIDIPRRATFAVHVATRWNNVMFLTRVYAYYPDKLFVRTCNRSTLLHIAARNHSVDCVRYLLQTCPHICKYQNVHEDTALHIALCNQHTVIIDLLIDCDSTIITSSKRSVFWLALWHKNTKIVTKLLKVCPQVANERYSNAGYILDTTIASGKTTLHHAIQMIRDKHIFTTLMCIQPNLLKQVNNCGKTALYVANAYDNREAIKAIIEFCPYVGYTDEDNNTPLHLILRTDASNALIMRVFNHNPSHMYVRNTKQNTPLHLCIAHYRNPAIFESYLRLEFLVDVYTECKMDLSQLLLKVQQQCNDCCLMRELQTIIFHYIGF